jgi:hypothetical protein
LPGVWDRQQTFGTLRAPVRRGRCGIGYLILRLVEKKGKKEKFRPSIVAVLNRQVDLPENE